MLVTVLPLRAIMFQILFLLTAIAVEAFVLEQKMSFTRRVSIEYAASLNLVSTVLGWLIFFIIQPLLPLNLQLQLISFILFGHFAPQLGFSLIRIFFDLGLFSLLIFLLVISIEFMALEFLTNLNLISMEAQSEQISYQSDASENTLELQKIDYYSERNKSKSLLIANAYSQTLILLISFLIQRI